MLVITIFRSNTLVEIDFQRGSYFPSIDVVSCGFEGCLGFYAFISFAREGREDDG